MYLLLRISNTTQRMASEGAWSEYSYKNILHGPVYFVCIKLFDISFLENYPTHLMHVQYEWVKLFIIM